jgi:hypothetical protein
VHARLDAGQRHVHDGHIEDEHELAGQDDGESESAARLRRTGSRFGAGGHGLLGHKALQEVPNKRSITPFLS